MHKSATTLKYLSIAGLVAGVILSFLDMSFGAIAFLCAIAFAHIAYVLRSDKHADDMNETLAILMNLSAKSKEKADSFVASGQSARNRPHTPTAEQRAET